MQPIPSARLDPGTGWLFEPLFGGRRCLAVLEEGEISLLEQGERPITALYPRLARALAEDGPDRFAVDGMIITVGVTSERSKALRSIDHAPGSIDANELEDRFLVLDIL